MGENSKIEWTDHTFNPWVGCTRVSPACDHCYAESWARRTGNAALWEGDRRRTSEANWQKPLAWDRQAEREGRRFRVFCASLADVFDNQVPRRWRDDLWHRVAQTPHLDWLLLTKRPQNIAKMLPDASIGALEWGDGWPNVWLGTTVENQTEADRRIPHLLKVPARVRFLSCEPLLGPLDLTNIAPPELPYKGEAAGLDALAHYNRTIRGVLDWVICGGESGPGARPMHPDWARSLRDQCAAAGVPYFFKQWGEHEPAELLDDERPEPWRRHADGRERWSFDELDKPRTELERVVYLRVGKKAAGRLLDGVEHNAIPERAAT